MSLGTLLCYYYVNIFFCIFKAVHCIWCAVIARSFAAATTDCAPSVHTAVSPANVAAAGNLPVSSYAFQPTKPTLSYVTRDLRAADHGAVVCGCDTETQRASAVSAGRQVLGLDETRHRDQLTAERSLLSVHQRPMHLSHSTDRMTPGSQYTQWPVDVHGTNVQRSHSFSTTSHQPSSNIGLLSVVLVKYGYYRLILN